MSAISSSQNKLLAVGTCSAALVIYLAWHWQWSALRPKKPGDDDENVDPIWLDDDGEFHEYEDSFPPQKTRAMHKEERRQKKIPLLAMKKPMYDNVRLLDPQGELLSTISLKKAKWYARKELAVWTDKTKPT